jgi:hypothetical protein
MDWVAKPPRSPKMLPSGIRRSTMRSEEYREENMQCERRQNRSGELSEALGLQLASSATRAKFSSLVLAEEMGLLVAGSGDAGELEEIAALAPLLAGQSRYWQGRVETAAGLRMVSVAKVDTALGVFYLSGVDGKIPAIWAELRLGSRGVARIVS